MHTDVTDEAVTVTEQGDLTEHNNTTTHTCKAVVSSMFYDSNMASVMMLGCDVGLNLLWVEVEKLQPSAEDVTSPGHN